MKVRVVFLSMIAAAMAFGADVTGKWTAEVPGRNGQMMTSTYDFKAEGKTLTGTVSNTMGDAKITNGKVDGDNLSFDVVREFNGRSITIHYKGTVSGDTINFKMEGGRGPARDVTAKRATT